MNSWPITPTAEPRATRATSGTVATTSAITTAGMPAPKIAATASPIRMAGKGQHDVDQPHDPAVEPAIVGGEDAEHAAEQAADQHAGEAHAAACCACRR